VGAACGECDTAAGFIFDASSKTCNFHAPAALPPPPASNDTSVGTAAAASSNSTLVAVGAILALVSAFATYRKCKSVRKARLQTHPERITFKTAAHAASIAAAMKKRGGDRRIAPLRTSDEATANVDAALDQVRS
jgi:hypothetical protein